MRPVPILLAALGAAPLALFGLEWAGVTELSWLRFQRPLLSFVTAPLALFLAYRLGALPGRMTALRRSLIEATVTLAALCATFVVLGLELGRPLDRLVVVVAVDRSRSIDLVPDATGRIASELMAAETSMREQDRIARVAFGASAALEDPPRPKTGLPSPQKAEIARDGTDLGAAIRQALAAIPPDSAARIALVSDGVATRGDALSAALSAAALGIPIDVVPLDQGKIPNVRVESLRLTPRAAEGEALDLKLITQSGSDAEIELRIYRDGELVRRGPTRITQGEDVVALREIAPGPGLHRYDVEITALDTKQDQAPDDNLGTSFVRVRGPSTALVIADDPRYAKPIAEALRGAAFEVSAVGPTATPADLAGFARHDLVVLGSISAADFSPSQLEALKSYVRDLGGGALLLGGEHSMGPGGYARTPVEDLSPVSFDLKQERRRASLSEIIAVDYSGSMSATAGGHTKLELANEAAVRSAELLGTGDRLGVFHVDTTVRVTVPLNPVADKADIARRIRAVGVGGGGIFVDLTLEAAYKALDRESTQLKHVLLFADGSDAEERNNAPALASRAKARGVTTSVVALGNGSDVPGLERLASIGGGRFYLVEDATRLPAVFAQETVIASRSAINEVSFVPALGSSGPALRGVDLGQAPTLTGYVVTIPKGRATVHLVGPENDPILASWALGIGRAGAFTSDYGDRWGRAWTDWPGAARLFGQLGRELARRADDPRIKVETDTLGGELSVRVTALDQRGQSDLFRRLHVKVAGPDGFSRDVALDATGAGSFSAKVPLSRPGSYLTTVVDDDTGSALATTGSALAFGEELRPSGTDRGQLARLSAITGGKVRTTLGGIFDDRELERRAYQALDTLWLILGASALLASVAVRRLSLSVPSWLRRRPKPAAASAPSAPSAADSGTLAALRAARKRSEVPATSAPAPRPASPPSAPQVSAQRSAPGRAGPEPAPSGPRSNPAKKSQSAAEILLERRRRRERGH
jgi:Ca-activated chloride channel family protein